MNMGGHELLQTFVNALVRNIPMWFLLLFALMLYVSKRDERPRAAGFVLISIIIYGLHLLFMPLVYPVVYSSLADNGMNPGQFTFQLLSAAMSLPSVLAHGLLFYAALMPDDAGGSRSYRRRYDEDDDFDRDDR